MKGLRLHQLGVRALRQFVSDRLAASHAQVGNRTRSLTHCQFGITNGVLRVPAVVPTTGVVVASTDSEGACAPHERTWLRNSLQQPRRSLGRW